MKTLFTLIFVLCSMMFAGCNGTPATTNDQCLRTEIFKQCMSSLPKGPTNLTAAGNDWDEVVDSCARAANWQSMRLTTQIKPECRGN